MGLYYFQKKILGSFCEGCSIVISTGRIDLENNIRLKKFLAY
jgi:hypothetical protein